MTTPRKLQIPHLYSLGVIFGVFSIVLVLPLCAAERPSEDSMFGGAAAPATITHPSGPAAVQSSTSSLPTRPPAERDDAREIESNGLFHTAFESGEVADNPLQIGGLYYQRWIASQEEGSSPSHDPVSAPLQFDAFMDARPNDRVRGYVQGRLLYDPTRDEFGNSTNGSQQGSLQYASTSGAPQSLPGGTTNQTTTQSRNNPQGVLDQAWLKFDMGRKVFVTAGKQHVKWGTGRFWNPTDLLSTQRRDPLLPYDLRLGNTMFKFELPLQRKGTNLYGIVLLDNPDAGSTLGQTGSAFRAETLFRDAEAGVEVVSRGHLAPVYGGDVSAPWGPFDVYGEAAVTMRSPTDRYQRTPAPLASSADLSTLYTADNARGPYTQITTGANYSFGWRANRLATLGAEYFYNGLGYSDASIYPVLIFRGQYQPFYTGRHYGALYLTAEGPDAGKKTSYTLSTLTNFSDVSYITRLDFSWRLLTYLTFEAYADGHYGHKGGEFNFSLHTPTLLNNGAPLSAISLPATVADLGLGLRLSF